MTALTTAARRTTFLRVVLAADATVTGVNGLVYLAAAGPVGDLLGPDAGLLRGLGIFLLGYGLAVGLLASRPVPGAAATWTVIALNACWTAASVAAVAAGALDLTVAGTVWALAQAVVVGVFAELQFSGLRRMR
jgi:hypothetical protein